MVKYNGFTLHPPRSRGGNTSWFMRGTFCGLQIERSTKTTDLEKAKSFVDRFVAANDETTIGPVELVYDAAWVIADDQPLPKWGLKLLDNARWRAKKRGVICDLTPDDIRALSQRAQARCEFSGIPFRGGYAGAKSDRRPFIPSLDRVVPEKGYTFANVRLVCFCVNVALSDWGEVALREVAVAICFGSRAPVRRRAESGTLHQGRDSGRA